MGTTKRDEEQQIMWLNKLPPGVKIPLTTEQMAKVAKMVNLSKYTLLTNTSRYAIVLNFVVSGSAKSQY
jgi:hypothetical protein